MNSNRNYDIPRYACPHCGSTEVRGDFDTYPVFLAEDNKIVYQRLESTDAGVSELYCNSCHELIVDGLSADLDIE